MTLKSFRTFISFFFLSLSLILKATPFEDELLLKLITATPGSVIELPEGTFKISKQLSLMVDEVTIQGKGMDKTILNFQGQEEGAEGLLITSNQVRLKDFTIQNTSGDGIKINHSKGVYINRVKVEWTGGPKKENGAYGFYPVKCEDVLIENSVAIGASDAGIYVGQSKNIIVRKNKAHYNVAGIEIENSVFADVYENIVTKNTGGILIFNMPDLTPEGHSSRVFRNDISDNNTLNFAPAKNVVADVPTGTGLMITANKKVEVFENTITKNNSMNILIVSYLMTGRPVEDETYDPIPEEIYIYNNILKDGGKDPKGGSSEHTQNLVNALIGIIGVPFPDIVFDGSKNPDHIGSNGDTLEKFKICIQEDSKTQFINLDAFNNFENLSRDLKPHDCKHSPLEEIKI